MVWLNETTSKGVRERGFELACDGRPIPGIAWTPEAAQAPTPLVLIGHGGGGHKREDHILALARRLVRRHGISAAAIDGPVHGDRQPPDLDQADPLARRRALRGGRVADDMIEDWKTALDALQKLDDIGVGPIGYWGLSMGTMFGLPLVAAEPRIQVAVLGLMGTGILGDDRLARDATEVRCPVLFLQQWDDELIPRDAGSKLFDAIASTDKRLHANPGAHSAVPPEEFGNTHAFLAAHLS